MRHFIFVLLIALLPLRGWMGDAMAVSMLAQSINAASSTGEIATIIEANNDHMTLTFASNASKNATQAGTGHPCHGMDAATDSVALETPAVNACTACQVCHLTASLPQPPPLLVQVRAHTLASQPPALWASADLSALTKPPVL